MDRSSTRPFSPGIVDLALLAAILIWAVNFSVAKAVLAYMPPLAFNTIRLVGASLTLVALAPLRSALTKDSSDAWAVFRPGSLTRGEVARIVLLGLIGHTLYQLCFIIGLAASTASNAALLLGLSPVAVAALGAISGVERTSARQSLGVVISVAGVYLVMGASRGSGGSLWGDVLLLAATLCWAAYTVAGKPLVDQHGPFKVSVYTFVIGTVFFIPFGVPSLVGLPYGQIPWGAWLGTAYSFVFALSAGYLIWYYAVSRVGPTRTAVYSNLTPALALVVSWLALDERLVPMQLAGAAVILLGIYIVRRA